MSHIKRSRIKSSDKIKNNISQNFKISPEAYQYVTVDVSIHNYHKVLTCFETLTNMKDQQLVQKHIFKQVRIWVQKEDVYHNQNLSQS